MISLDNYLSRVTTAIQLHYPDGLQDAAPGCYSLKGGYDCSMSWEELRHLQYLISGFKFRNCFVIGNAFGLSSAYMALVMADNGGDRIVTIDNLNVNVADTWVQMFSKTQQEVADSLIRNLNLPLTYLNVVGSSPQDLPAACGETKYDLVLIDGLHTAEAVFDDFTGMLSHSVENTLFVFHDLKLRPVSVGVNKILVTHPDFAGHIISTTWDLGFVARRVHLETYIKGFPNATKIGLDYTTNSVVNI